MSLMSAFISDKSQFLSSFTSDITRMNVKNCSKSLTPHKFNDNNNIFIILDIYTLAHVSFKQMGSLVMY